MPTDITHHAPVELDRIGRLPSSPVHDFHMPEFLHSLFLLLPVLNRKLRTGYGVEVDFLVAGSAALQMHLDAIVRPLNYPIESVGDLDIFVAYRQVGDPAQVFLEVVVRNYIVTLFNSLLDRHLTPSLGAEGSATQSNIVACYRGLAPKVKEINLIFRSDLMSDNFTVNLQTLFNSFDLDILRCSIALTQTDNQVARVLPSRSIEFTEAVNSMLVTSSEGIRPERSEKYKQRLEPLGFEFSWDLT